MKFQRTLEFDSKRILFAESLLLNAKNTYFKENAFVYTDFIHAAILQIINSLTIKAQLSSVSNHGRVEVRQVN